MSRPWALSMLIAVLSFPALANDSSRIRLENASQPGSRVTIAFADPARTPARLETGDDGIAELVVEAPSPRLRLRGGSLRTDPMIEAIARRQLRDASPAPNLIVIDHVDTPAQFSSFDGPLVYDDWAGDDLEGAYWGVSWRGGFCDGGGRGRLRDIPVAREIPRTDRAERPDPPARPRRSYSARAVMPRLGGHR
ncbi:MAG: hypothetical protein NDJ92_03860 [Thermoanaerobaculia bacterium]|nr:hypothetical protein [Thermoanaerobaculia bacterium]